MGIPLYLYFHSGTLKEFPFFSSSTHPKAVPPVRRLQEALHQAPLPLRPQAAARGRAHRPRGRRRRRAQERGHLRGGGPGDHVSGVPEGLCEPPRRHVAHEDALGVRGSQAALLRHLQQDVRREGLLQVTDSLSSWMPPNF